MGMFAEDLKRYRGEGVPVAKDLWLEPAVWAIASYGLSNWLYRGEANAALIRVPLKVVSFVTRKFCVVVMEMDLDAKATIGGGLYVGHIGGVHINPGAVLGERL
jgi:serine O-acetyltransferase